MTVKERIIAGIEHLGEDSLEHLEARLLELRLAEEFQLLDELAEPMGEEDRRAFDEAVRRQPWRIEDAERG